MSSGIMQQHDWGSRQHPTFCGIPMAQWWDDLQLWEWFLNEFSEIGQIIEIGTYEGGLSLYLALQCRARGIEFVTYDNGEAHQGHLVYHPLREFVLPSIRRGDVWESAGDDIRALIAHPDRRPLLLFCDDGDKPREYRTFAPLLRPGDYIGVHDWCDNPEAGEFHASDIDHELTDLVYADVYRPCNHTRFFRRK